MQEHEYRARDKTVKKMSRDGLKEENLHSRKSIRVSNRETDDFFGYGLSMQQLLHIPSPRTDAP